MINGSIYEEAVRYFNNAVDILRSKAKKEGRYYQDAKYVRMACATAYNAVLIALDEYLKIKGMPVLKKNHQRKKVEDYEDRLSRLDKKMLNEFNNAYEILHLAGYYDGITVYDTIKSGMNSASILINKIKPRS